MLRQEFIYICRFVKSISPLVRVFGAFRALKGALNSFKAVSLNSRFLARQLVNCFCVSITALLRYKRM